MSMKKKLMNALRRVLAEMGRDEALIQGYAYKR